MAAGTLNGGGRGGSWVRVVLWGGAAALLALPAVAMQFTGEVNWTASDFVFAAVVFGTIGLLAEGAVRMSGNGSYQAGAGFALAAAFATVWANGAVGMIGNEDNAYNLLFLGVVAAALLGAVVARFRAGGMGIAMLAAGLGHAGVALGGYSVDPRGATFSLAFVLLWLLSAALFRNARTG
ncbi:MAG TPA: hypothetical protein VF655_07435 [Allosphingosinicella sp.]|jgi:hypothetical protein